MKGGGGTTFSAADYPGRSMIRLLLSNMIPNYSSTEANAWMVYTTDRRIRLCG